MATRKLGTLSQLTSRMPDIGPRRPPNPVITPAIDASRRQPIRQIKAATMVPAPVAPRPGTGTPNTRPNARTVRVKR